jgi:hypothetical protein
LDTAVRGQCLRRAWPTWHKRQSRPATGPWAPIDLVAGTQRAGGGLRVCSQVDGSRHGNANRTKRGVSRKWADKARVAARHVAPAARLPTRNCFPPTE